MDSASEKIIPQGKVQLDNGEIIDKANRCFRLREHPQSKKLLFDHSDTCYVKDEKGTLRRYPPKEKHKKKNKNLGGDK